MLASFRETLACVIYLFRLFHEPVVDYCIILLWCSKQAPALDSGSRAAPPLPRNGPPLPASQGSSRPPIPRGHLPPPPDLGGGDYEDPMVAMNEAGDMPPWGGGSGMIPDEEDGYGEEPTDIYGAWW